MMITKPWLIGSLLLIIIISGCTGYKTEPTNVTVTQPVPKDTVPTIDFISIANGNSNTAELDDPTIFVAGSAKEIEPFIGWLDEGVANRIRRIDFNSSFVVAVFSGRMGSDGYGITIQRINLVSEVVKIEVKITEPAPDRAYSDVITYPYGMILINREKLQVTNGTVWSVYAPDGTMLTQISYP